MNDLGEKERIRLSVCLLTQTGYGMDGSKEGWNADNSEEMKDGVKE